MRRQLLPALRMLLVMTLLTGVIYPVVVTAVALGVFPARANGSLISVEDRVIGSSLIGQPFTGERFFHPRPSAVGYDASASSGSNRGPTNPELLAEVSARVADYRAVNGLDSEAPVPVDAVTTSASGLDPHISPANAALQAPRVASARGLDLDMVLDLVEEHTRRSVLDVLAAPAVNVFELNIALEEVAP